MYEALSMYEASSMYEALSKSVLLATCLLYSSILTEFLWLRAVGTVVGGSHGSHGIPGVQT
jgi:hypothetical protein